MIKYLFRTRSGFFLFVYQSCSMLLSWSLLFFLLLFRNLYCAFNSRWANALYWYLHGDYLLLVCIMNFPSYVSTQCSVRCNLIQFLLIFVQIENEDVINLYAFRFHVERFVYSDKIMALLWLAWSISIFQYSHAIV